jgi:PPOX class probable F420-dependent enzyme
MTDDEVRAYLEAGRDLQVASIGPDGAPHLVTMWYVVRGGAPTFWTYAKSQKVLNLRRDPRISALVSSGDRYEELRGVSIRGTAEIVDDPEAVLDCGLAIYERYWGPITSDAERDGVRAMGAKRVVIVVRPETVLSWDHGKLGGAY